MLLYFIDTKVKKKIDTAKCLWKKVSFQNVFWHLLINKVNAIQIEARTLLLSPRYLSVISLICDYGCYLSCFGYCPNRFGYCLNCYG